MVSKLLHSAFYTALFSCMLYAQEGLILHASANYTTTAKMYLSPSSADPSLRNRYYELQGMVSPSVEVRYRFTEEIAVGICAELIGKTDGARPLTVLSNGITRSVLIEDGFSLIPIEINLYYILPFSNEDFRLSMNGGMAYYIGRHVRNAGTISVRTAERRPAYGIQVGILGEYRIWNDFFLSGGMKFRDPQYQVTSRYSAKKGVLDGRTIELAQDAFDSKINVDGVTFFLGVAWELGK